MNKTENNLLSQWSKTLSESSDDTKLTPRFINSVNNIITHNKLLQ